MLHISKAQIKLVRSLQLKKNRDELSLFVAEGNKCIEELSKVFKPYLYIKEESHTGCLNASNSVTATAEEIRQMSSLKTPQGAIAIFHKQPAWSSTADCTDAKTAATAAAALTLVLDGVQDPGNLGTIIRTAVWFGVTEIVCSPDTADCFGPKVVQATMGALAQVHITYRDLPSWLASVHKTPIYGTLLDGKNIYDVLSDSHQHGKAVIIMGSEGNGISPAVRPFITHPVYIPTYAAEGHGIESLNVAIATAITLSIFRRQLP